MDAHLLIKLIKDGLLGLIIILLTSSNISSQCTSFLYVPSELSGIQIGNLTINGNQLTVEAVFNRTLPYSRGYLYAGDLVSKHNGPGSVNYLLRPSDAEITTTNGYYRTPDICPIDLNKTYHVAMVYDGSSLKFYRNGYLMSSAPAFGDLLTNNLLTTIGSAANRATTDTESLLGYINEVRIWNVARTQSQIQNFFKTSLPNPTTQIGLQAYYQFNSLNNLQGNPAWNGTIVGNASINQTNPTCAAFTPDSCGIVKPVIPSVGFTAPDTVCLNTPINLINKSSAATSSYWNFCSADVNGNVSPLTLSQTCSTTIINILSSSSETPPPINYSTPGTYNICLTIDQGLPSQASFCKQIVVNPPSTALDFSFEQDNCNPLMVTFHNKSVPLPGITFSYDFGDGSSATEPNLVTSTKYYNNYNDYTITLSNVSGCADTIQKIIPVHLSTDSLIINNDTSICKYSSVQLQSINSNNPNNTTNYCWHPTIGLSDPHLQNPTASPKESTTYYLNAQTIGANLIENGDFSNGNTGFFTDYHDSINGYHVGTFTVDTTATIWHPFVSRCHDHTSGNGKMMIVNGSSKQVAVIWQQTINNLTPNTDYLFSVWLQSLSIANPAQIQFYVNGNPIGVIFNAILDTCIWQQPLTTWNSANNTTATIAIVNQDTIGAGNDFALDDISFSATSIVTDSVRITVNAPLQSPNVDTTICLGNSVELIANLANSYSWAASPFLSSLTIQNPVATPTVSSVFKVNRYDIKGCYATDTFNVNVQTRKASLDFSFSENICNPLNIQFVNESTNSNAYLWHFGDGNSSVAISPLIAYQSYGTYKVTLQNTDGCVDSVTKYVSISLLRDSLISTKDTTICVGDSLKLKTIPALEYCWYPTTGLSDPTIANPIVKTVVPTTYYVNAKVPGNNLIVNGDFSQGNTGFTSKYKYNDVSGKPEGVYWIGSSPYPWHPSFSKCSDHTSNSGNFMLVNGSSTPGLIVWEENVTIQSNTNYAFSTWGESISPGNPALLQFTINGKRLGNVFSVPGPDTTCLWRQFYVIWNSGNNTSADITIINLNTITGGNDFALDDISFAKVGIEKDSINITIKPTPSVSIENDDTAICSKDSFQLKAKGAVKYQWTPTNSLSSNTMSNPIAFPNQNTKYYVTGTNAQGCSGKDSISVIVNPLPIFSLTKDTAVCLGNSIPLLIQSSTVNSYTWYPQDYLSSTIDPNPIASPLDTIRYYVIVTDQDNNCSNKDSVKIIVGQLPKVKTRIDTSICLHSTTNLFTTTNADHVRWNPTIGLSDSTNVNPIDTATSLGTTSYTVTAYSKLGCISTDKVKITSLSIPTVKVKIDSLSICKNHSIQILTTSSSNVKYNWIPATGLSSAIISNPIAKPDTTSTFRIRVTDVNNCFSEDSVYIHVRPLPVFTISPNPATICRGDSVLLTASGGDKYHWLGYPIAQPDSASNMVYPSSTTTYKVSVTDTLCAETAAVSLTVQVNNPPSISFIKSNDIDCFHTSSILKIMGGASYLWTTSSTIVSNDNESITVAPFATQVYAVKAFSDKGCEADSSIRVNVIKGDIGNGFPSANAFTPTIGSNNCFGVKEWGYLKNLQLSIFNRSGKRIFYTTSLDGCWDGTVYGKMQDAGTYVYEIKASTLCGEVYRKGTLVLIR